MRILLLGAATIALSGCSFLGQGDKHDYKHHNYNQYSYGTGAYTPPAPKPCHSTQCLSRWNLEGGIGTEVFAGGTVISGDARHNFGAIPASPSVPVALPAIATTAADQSFSDVYDNGVRVELGGSYALTPNRKVTLTGHYAHAAGENVTFGTVENLGTGDIETISGEMGDYDRYGAELGLRQYLPPSHFPIVKSIRPYVEGRIGASYVEAIDVTNLTATTPLGAAGAYGTGASPFYDDSWTGSAAGLIGVETPLTKFSTIGLETGLRYTTPLESSTNSFPGTSSAIPGDSRIPLTGINNDGASWTVPIMLRGRYRF